MKKALFAVPALLLITACGGGGSANATPQVYAVAGSYFGTVVSSSNNSGNMGLTTDSVGNGNFAVQFPGLAPLTETFAPPVSSVSGSTLAVNGSIASSCGFALTATMSDANTIKGSYTLTCPGQSNVTATFTLPRGNYATAAHAHRMVP